MLAARAPVKPRTISPETGDVVPLEDAILSCVEERKTGVVQIIGRHGSGRTWALQHLLAVLPPRPHVRFVDNAMVADIAEVSSSSLVVCGSLASDARLGDVVLRLTPWGNDDLIEFLLAVHPQECQSVMRRLTEDQHRSPLNGLPELWRIVLDRMVIDPSITSIKEALRKDFENRYTNSQQRELVHEFCLHSVIGLKPKVEHLEAVIADSDIDPSFVKLMRHEIVRETIAAGAFIAALRDNTDTMLSLGIRWTRQYQLPLEFVMEVATLVEAPDLQELNGLMRWGQQDLLPVVASILYAEDAQWKPPLNRPAFLMLAYLPNVKWSGINLSAARLDRADLRNADLSCAMLNQAALDGADLRNADLSQAKLNQANMRGTRLGGAVLQGASIQKAWANDADLSGADLSLADLEASILRSANLAGANLRATCLRYVDLADANLRDATFRLADLQHAILHGADIDGTDIGGADLQFARMDGLHLRLANFAGACFAHAELVECDLEGIALPDADFQYAVLLKALLSGSIIPRANFHNANLRQTGLADIEWEGADLKGADLRGATFHMGSSRSGLVDSPIASEGTRTGFYTDDYEEQHFKSPEEIRKANLCGADLVGALIDGVDFYLVDLRGANYTENQRQHFERCSAILYDHT